MSNWEYLYLSEDGRIVYDSGTTMNQNITERFKSVESADEYLKSEDIRGTVVGWFNDFFGGYYE